MTVEINGVKVNGVESQNPTKKAIAVEGTVFNENGEEVAYESTGGRVQYTGGINWDKPIADIGKYLQDGTNTIKIVYNSSLTNAALAAGVIEERGMESTTWYKAPALWWGTDVTYRSNGPAQAKLVPYCDIQIAE